MNPKARRIAAVAAAAGMAGYAGNRAFHMWRKRAQPGLPSRRLQRTARLARASARTTTDFAMMRARQAGKSEIEKRALEETFHLRTAEQAMEMMGEMKGALMKIGQLVSFIDSGLPEPYRQALASLQADAPPMAPELVAEVVQAELGGAPGDVFADFSTHAVAAASIGQVHRATLKDGREAVVKVQYPGVDEAIRADLENADLLYTMMRAVYPNLDPTGVVDELRDRIGEELDYARELKNQQTFLDVYRGHPFIRVPEVFPEFSTRRLLTMERAEGLRWREALEAPLELRNQWAEVIFRFVFGTINRFHMFNGDPHPGNYLFHDDGTVTFLDYGCVKYWPAEHIEHQRRLVGAVWENDPETLRTELVRAGFIGADDDFDPKRYVEWFRQWDVPYLVEQFTYTPEFAEAAVRANYDPTSEWGPVAKRMNLPRDYVFLTRINLGLNSILAGLEATNRWRAICNEWWIGAPPATELGHLEAAFFAR